MNYNQQPPASKNANNFKEIETPHNHYKFYNFKRRKTIFF